MRTIAKWVLIVLVAVGLGIDAYTHYDLASLYKFNRTSVLNEGFLFQVEATLAVVVGVGLIVKPNRLTAGLAFLVAAGGAVLLVIYRYNDIGRIGIIPNMYEPIWTTEKKWSLAGEILAAVASIGLIGVLPARSSARAVLHRTGRTRTAF